MGTGAHSKNKQGRKAGFGEKVWSSALGVLSYKGL